MGDYYCRSIPPRFVKRMSVKNLAVLSSHLVNTLDKNGRKELWQLVLIYRRTKQQSWKPRRRATAAVGLLLTGTCIIVFWSSAHLWANASAQPVEDCTAALWFWLHCMLGVLVRDGEESFEGSFVGSEMHYYIAHGKVSLFFPFVS